MGPFNFRLTISVFALLFGLGSPAFLGAGEPPLQDSFEGAPLAAWPLAQGARVELDGQVISLNLGPGTLLSSLRGTPNGFLLAGSIAPPTSTPDTPPKRDIFVAAGDSEATFRLPKLSHTELAIRCQPVLLTESGRLVGVAWLEGNAMDTMAVRAARWNGKSWARMERVAGQAPGSQLALAGTVLADGSWLLAWSRFDGQDDEIVWSRRLGAQWSEAKNVSSNNGVPDVVPALHAEGTEALLAWSRYDGNDYRLQTARFTGGEWSTEQAVGPAGSLFPSFMGENTRKGANRSLILYRTAQPRGWTVAELGPAAGFLRKASIAAPGTARPVVSLSDDGGGVRFRWPDRKKADQWVPWATTTETVEGLR